MIYGDGTFDDLARVVDLTVDKLKKHAHEFDTIVVCGLSGVVVGSPVALRLCKPLVIIRKADDTNIHHCGGQIVNPYRLERSRRYLILDDFISSGRTVKYIHDRVTLALKHALDGQPKCVGACLYEELCQDSDAIRDVSTLCLPPLPQPKLAQSAIPWW
jgi:orotate phosphoribosyltransferase-like protein